jgi:UDP-GlcNAc3NAcA epimerase
MFKLLTLVGARPQFIKSAAISRTIRNYFSLEIEEILVHSGQHYDSHMSDLFFQELDLLHPKHKFDLKTSSHSSQTSEIIQCLDLVIQKESPHAILVYGDTNTTLAGALVASKSNIPLIHIEAGLRSFNKTMPEEINRVLTDHCSSLLFCSGQSAIDYLANEGIVHSNTGECSVDAPKVFKCGDIMYDNSMYFSQKMSEDNYVPISSFKNFLLFTMHRPSNTDKPKRLQAICEMLMTFSTQQLKKIVFPLHPRTKKALEESLDHQLLFAFLNHPWIQVIQPVSFKEMISLQRSCDFVITDSGGVQKEAYFFEKPCLILRPETEWIQIIDQGAAILVDAELEDLTKKYNVLSKSDIKYPKLFGDGNSSHFICQTILEELS